MSVNLVTSGPPIFVGLILTIWFVATVFFQFDAPGLLLSRLDIFRILPRWTFFSPNPGQHDMHLLCRDRTGSGTLSEWLEVDFIATPAAIPVLWNPEKRFAKVLWDCWASIQHLGRQEGHNPLYLPMSGAYIVLLNIALRFPRAEGAFERQFALMRSQGFINRTIQPIFVSTFHQLPSCELPSVGSEDANDS